MSKKNGAEILGQKVMYEKRGLVVIEEQFKMLNDQKERTYRYCEMTSSIRIVAITEKKEVVFIEEFKYPVDEFVLSLPAGSVEDGETPLEAGARELLEESGYTGQSFQDLGLYYPMAGTLKQEARVILARGCQVGDSNNTDEYEKAQIKKVELIQMNDVYDAIRSGKLRDGQTLTALLMAISHLKSEGLSQ